MNFNEKLFFFSETVSNELSSILNEKEVPEKKIYKAMRYSIMAGGKRLRPVLALAVTEIFNGETEDVLPFACAVEMIHTYSLIHDDLPSMDNDDFRRGVPANHKVFGEAIAILAGDALLNYAFELMLEACMRESKINLASKVKAMEVIARSSGVKGMIGGQVIDLEAENNVVSPYTLKRMHRMKTGALIKAPVISAGILHGATEEELNCLEGFSENLGLAFQIKDDILDVEGSTAALGKNLGSDSANKKSTFISLYGLEESKKMLSDTTYKAIEYLDYFGENGQFLSRLSEYLLKRKS